MATASSTGKAPGRAARAAGAKVANMKDPAPPKRTDEARRAADLLKQVSDATRLRVLLILSEGETNVGDLCKAMGDVSQPACSHHLALLRYSGLILPRREGKNNIYMLTGKGEALAAAVRPLVEG